jgi:hypothetical protein
MTTIYGFQGPENVELFKNRVHYSIYLLFSQQHHAPGT